MLWMLALFFLLSAAKDLLLALREEMLWEDLVVKGVWLDLLITWASLVAKMVKSLPALWETWVQSLGWEDPLEKRTATHSSILENSMDRGAWQATVHGSQRVGHNWETLTSLDNTLSLSLVVEADYGFEFGEGWCNLEYFPTSPDMKTSLGLHSAVRIGSWKFPRTLPLIIHCQEFIFNLRSGPPHEKRRWECVIPYQVTTCPPVSSVTVEHFQLQRALFLLDYWDNE